MFSKIINIKFFCVSIIVCFSCACSPKNKNSRFTDSFYKRVVMKQEIQDDSSICGNYVPRPITKNSITSYCWYKEINGYSIVNMKVNGYGLFYIPFFYDEEDSKIIFCKDINPLLSFYAFKGGNCYSLEEVYEKGLLLDDDFKKMTLETNDVDSYYLSKKYYEKLPYPIGYHDHYSRLKPEYQKIKDSILLDLFLDQSIPNDSFYYDIAKKDWGDEYFVKNKIKPRFINDRSIFLKYLKGVINNKFFLEIDVNYLTRFSYSSTFFVEPKYLNIDGFDYSYYGSFEPIVYINNHSYTITDAYQNGLITKDEMAQLDNYSGPNFIETRLEEYQYFLPNNCYE